MKIVSNISFLFTKRLFKNVKNCKNDKKVGLLKKKKKKNRGLVLQTVVLYKKHRCWSKVGFKKGEKILQSYSQVLQKSGTNLSSSKVGAFGTYERISYWIYHHMLLF